MLLMAAMVCFLPACSDDDPVLPNDGTEQGGGEEGGGEDKPETDKEMSIVGLNVPQNVVLGESLEIKGANFPENVEVYLTTEDGTQKFQLTVKPTASGLSCTLPAEVVAGSYKVLFCAKGFVDLVWKNLLAVEAPAKAKRIKKIALNMVMGEDMMELRSTTYTYAKAEDIHPTTMEDNYMEIIMTYNITAADNTLTGNNQAELVNNDIKSFVLNLENGVVKTSNYTEFKTSGDKLHERTWDYTAEGVCNSVNGLSDVPMADMFSFDKAAQKNNPAGIDAGMVLFEYAIGCIGKNVGYEYDLTAGILLGCTGTRMEMLPSSITTMGAPVDVIYEADADGYITSMKWSEADTMGADMKIILEYEAL